MAWLTKLAEARADLDKRDADPWKRKLERDLPASVTSISTVALLDLLMRPQQPAMPGVSRRRCAPWVSFR